MQVLRRPSAPNWGREEALIWAYTSNIIRTKLDRQGRHVPSVDEALNTLAEQGVSDLAVQSLHVMGGEEFTKLDRLLQSYALRYPRSLQDHETGPPPHRIHGGRPRGGPKRFFPPFRRKERAATQFCSWPMVRIRGVATWYSPVWTP